MWARILKFKWYILAGLILLGGWYFFGLRNQKDTYAKYTVSRGSIEDILELSGKVQAATVANLRFPAGGLITYIGVKEGDQVKKYQTLAALDTRQLQKSLDQKLNLYSIQRGTFDQTIDDNDNSVPDGDLSRTLKRLLEKNQYQLENTVKDVEYLDLSLKLSKLSSPIAGILVNSPTDTAGVSVLASESWLVVDPASLYFSADLDETDLQRVKEGQNVRIHLDAYPDLTIESQVSNIAFSPKETTSGTVYELRLNIPPTSLANLRLGLNGTTQIILTKKSDILLLPSSAVTFEGDHAKIYIKEGDKYIAKDIVVGIENDGNIEIVSGLSEGTDVYVPKN